MSDRYAWVVLAAGTVGLILTSPGQTYAVSIFIERFIQDLGISRSLVSTLYTVGTLTASMGLPLIGRLIDRNGTRAMVALIAVGLGAACLYMGSVRGPIMLALGFVALRMFGQGSLELVSKTVINHWWVRRRGMATGISSLLSSVLGTGLWPIFIQALIAFVGWRAAYRWLGLSVIAVMLPIGLLFYRRPPEAYGLAPDADLDAPDPQRAPLAEEEHWTVQEALRTKAFWVASLGLASMSMLTTGLHFHMVGIIADAGLTPTLAAQIFLPMATTGALVVLVGGILADRIAVRFLLATALAFQALSLVMAPLLGSVWFALLYGVILGATGGLQSAVSNVIWPTYFGRRHLGSIAGITYSISVAGSSLGPMPMGIARDLLGSFGVVLNVLAIIPLALALLSLTIQRPRRELVRSA